MVDVAPGNEQESPDAKYLAEKNNRVDKETKAKDQTPFYRNAMPRQTATQERKTTGKDESPQLIVQGNNGTGQDARPAQKGGGQKPVLELPNVKKRDQIALKEQNTKGAGPSVNNQGESVAVQGNAQRLRIDPGKPGDEGDQGSAGRVGLPTLSQLDAQQRRAGQDHRRRAERPSPGRGRRARAPSSTPASGSTPRSSTG